mmetsp:Transcript_189/g.423  ORF Transcript_189/g.423 Transcript_189/m.423 type:complete len:227 (-) Transcript_189:900-1580(-)
MGDEDEEEPFTPSPPPPSSSPPSPPPERSCSPVNAMRFWYSECSMVTFCPKSVPLMKLSSGTETSKSDGAGSKSLLRYGPNSCLSFRRRTYVTPFALSTCETLQRSPIPRPYRAPTLSLSTTSSSFFRSSTTSGTNSSSGSFPMSSQGFAATSEMEPSAAAQPSTSLSSANANRTASPPAAFMSTKSWNIWFSGASHTFTLRSDSTSVESMNPTRNAVTAPPFATL